jgi:hypothetical protein
MQQDSNISKFKSQVQSSQVPAHQLLAPDNFQLLDFLVILIGTTSGFPSRLGLFYRVPFQRLSNATQFQKTSFSTSSDVHFCDEATDFGVGKNNLS